MCTTLVGTAAIAVHKVASLLQLVVEAVADKPCVEAAT